MHHVGYVVSDGFQLMSVATHTVFEFANLVASDRFYDTATYSAAGGAVRSSSGVVVDTLPLGRGSRADTWMAVGGIDPGLVPSPDAVVALLRRSLRHARRVAGLCTGTFVLGEAGLLAGRHATTHWAHAARLRSLYPDALVEEDRIYIVDGPVWTSAGMSAAFDLALAMVENDLGDDVARAVAHKLVLPQRRAGGQTQHSELLHMAPKSDRIQAAMDYARAHLKRPLSVEELAEVASLSPRQFSRVFTAEIGVPPARAVEAIRLEAARLLIERSRHPMEIVARETGFRDGRHLREVYVRRLGIPPQSSRRASREAVM